ncbi:MAG: SAM-dependent methyltransferase, partial [Clostridium sp.]
HSGLDTSKFSFRGFIPRDNKGRNALLEDIKDHRETLIFYEAPHRLLSTLTFLKESFGDRKIAACRELTKLHEEIVRGTIGEVIEFFKEKAPRGEFVLVLSGLTDEEIESDKRKAFEDLSIEDHIRKYISEGLSKKDAIKKVAKDRNEPKSVIYKYSTEI